MKNCVAVFLACLLIFTALSGCEKNKEYTDTGIYFDTAVTFTSYGKQVPKKVWQICEKYNTLFSATNKSSDVYALNIGAKSTVNKDTAELIKKSLDFCKISGGKLDITVYPLKKAWGFYGENPKVPAQNKIDRAKSLINYKNIAVSGNTVTLKNGCGIDLGAVAKGYIADKLAQIYKKTNTVGIIDLGGNIMLPLKKKDGTPFLVGIVNPKNKNTTIATVKIKSGSVVTSGTYQRFFKQDGKKYHHILDVNTGYPTNNGIESVTVISPRSLTADALSTAVMCMGEKDGLKLIEATKNTYAVIVKSNGSLVLSKGLKKDGKYIYCCNK